MKKHTALITFLIFMLLNGLKAQQSLTLSFEALHYYEGQQVRLDSILIKNINRNCDTMLYSPDTVLYYNFYVGTREHELNDFKVSVYPNPADYNQTSVKIILPENGNLSLYMYDIYGRFITKHINKCYSGIYIYNLNLPYKGYFIVKVRFNNITKTLKVINNKMESKPPAFKQISFLKIQNNKNANKYSGGFWYEPGDTLWLVGFAKTVPFEIAASDIIEDVPVESKHYIFIVVEGLPCPDVLAVKYSGHLYPTVQIDDDCWLKENLNIGTMIPGDSTMSDNGIIEKYCYDNDTNNCNTYGGLYQWNELMNYTLYEKTQGICPEGWHIPVSDELFHLIEDFDADGCRERGDKHWISGRGTNKKGFSAYGAGYRQIDKLFYQLKEITAFFSSTTLTYDWVWYMDMDNLGHMAFGSAKKEAGFSVRCIKDK